MSAGIASRTQLPPSPELRGASGGLPPLDRFSLDDSTTTNVVSRLRSMARYQALQPQALACSSPTIMQDSSFHSDRTTRNRNINGSMDTTALGAVAGVQGVGLFSLVQPHAPLMILHCASTGAGVISDLAFSASQQQKHLAAARGTGVLVWDVSGHSTRPLTHRLGMQHGSSGGESRSSSSRVTALAWQPSDAPWLAATTVSSVCLWDLRQSTTACTLHKPSMRFGVTRRNHTANATGSTGSTVMPWSPYVSLACSQQECAVLDASGTLRVFDTRMQQDRRGSANGGALLALPAFDNAAIGVASMRTSEGTDCWVTWGLDAPQADPIVKVWSSSSSSAPQPPDETTSATLVDPNDDWCLDGSSSPGYRLLGKCAVKNLACARVCPAPVEDTIVTVSLDGQDNEAADASLASWRADLWKLSTTGSTSSRNGGTSMTKIVSFAGGDGVDKNMVGMVGNNNSNNNKSSSLGQLYAAEVAVSSYGRPVAFRDGNNSSSNSEGQDDFGLLLCSLTKGGFVTTHAIPEVTIPDRKGARQTQAASGGSRREVDPPTRMFPGENDETMHDAAKLWDMVADGDTTRGGTLDGQDPSSRNQLDGSALLPFDMDLPVSYSVATAGMAGVQLSGVAEGASNVASGLESGEDDDHASTGARDAAELMQNIETHRIPCPRLCGATFGPGVGGFCMFNNGEVKKMWQWYEKTHPTQVLAYSRGLGGERAKDARGGGHGDGGMTEDMEPVNQQCPRTMKELLDMTSAAKEAQFLQQEDSGESESGFPTVGDAFFEDESDDSSESADQQSDSDGESKGMYENYFGGSQRPLAEPWAMNVAVTQSSDGLEASLGPTASDVGHSSDVLAPEVRYSHSISELVLSGQTIDLALGLKLGSLDCSSSWDVDIGEGLNSTDLRPSPREAPPSGLPSYRLLPSPAQYTRKLPSLGLDAPTTSGPEGIKVGSFYREDDQGVHGGKYGIRPNKQESMAFLRKLFTHQNQQEGGENLPSLMSPPDGPMLPNSMLSSGKDEVGLDEHGKGTTSPVQLGVYCLQTDSAKSGLGRDEQLETVKQICLHNAHVCREHNDVGKQGTWDLLASIVESRIHEVSRGFDGWGGMGGGALGAGLVDSLLRYYESLGDAQMLSTIVCVLGSIQGSPVEGSPRRYLLTPGKEKYDLYIRRYADLLYAWGLLTTRAELNKHLTRPLLSEHGEAMRVDGKGQERQPGIAPVFMCPKCSNDTELGTNFCRSCQDYAFRCAICDNAVRGLFTICDSCGHGGHVTHLQTWFASQEECPAGCGCKCTLAKVWSGGEGMSVGGASSLSLGELDQNRLSRLEI